MEFLISFFTDYGYWAVLFVLSCMYWLGRIYGTRILRFRPMRKVLTLQRLKMVREKFAQYGNRVLFVARFLPGLRAPIYMVSGITRRVSYTRFVLIDFCAAIISVPIWVYLGELGAKNLDWLHEQIQKGQLVIYILVGALSGNGKKRRNLKLTNLVQSNKKCGKKQHCFLPHFFIPTKL